MPPLSAGATTIYSEATLSDIIDLDVLVPTDKKITLGGLQYAVPGDMPLLTFMKINRVGEQQEDDNASQLDALDTMIDALVELVCWRIPEHDVEARPRVEKQLRRMGLSTLTKLLGSIYPSDEQGEVDEEAAAVVDPPAAGEPGSQTTSS